jgi:hypothetical protein
VKKVSLIMVNEVENFNKLIDTRRMTPYSQKAGFHSWFNMPTGLTSLCNSNWGKKKICIIRKFLVPGDDVVAYTHGEKSAQILRSTGFQNIIFRPYEGYLLNAFLSATKISSGLKAKILLKAFFSKMQAWSLPYS